MLTTVPITFVAWTQMVLGVDSIVMHVLLWLPQFPFYLGTFYSIVGAPTSVPTNISSALNYNPGDFVGILSPIPGQEYLDKCRGFAPPVSLCATRRNPASDGLGWAMIATVLLCFFVSICTSAIAAVDSKRTTRQTRVYWAATIVIFLALGATWSGALYVVLKDLSLDTKFWSFGQILAVSIWLPVTLKSVYWMTCMLFFSLTLCRSLLEGTYSKEHTHGADS